MGITKEQVKSSIASFIWVGLLLSGGLYYLDQQRLDIAKEQQEALKLKIEADLKLQQYAAKEKLLLEKEGLIKEKFKEQVRDKELSDLTLKFINEVSDINFHRQCGDDPEHNAKARKANALLDLIEAKSLEYEREALIEKFVKAQRFGIGGWSSKCKS